MGEEYLPTMSTWMLLKRALGFAEGHILLLDFGSLTQQAGLHPLLIISIDAWSDILNCDKTCYLNSSELNTMRRKLNGTTGRDAPVEMSQMMVEADVGKGISLKVREKWDDHSLRSSESCCRAAVGLLLVGSSKSMTCACQFAVHLLKCLTRCQLQRCGHLKHT